MSSPGRAAGTPYGYTGMPGAAQMPTMVPWHRTRVARILLMIAAVGVVALGGLIMLIVIGSAVGPGSLLLAASTAVIPVPIVIASLLWLDRYQPEPWHYLALTFGWGACVATAVAYVLNSVGAEVAVASVGDAGETITGVLIAPPVEETLKAVPLFILLVLSFLGRRRVAGVVDGIVYAGVAAVGFAFTENILYFGASYSEETSEGTGGFTSLFWTFILRGVFSPFAHPLFTCFTGIGVGLAVRSRNWAVRILAPLGGLLLAIGLHALWNLLASFGNILILALGYFAIMVPVFAAMVGVAIWVRSREAKVVGIALPRYVRIGLITPQEIASLTSMRARGGARRWAKQVAGPYGAEAMKGWQFAATKLAVLRDTIDRGIAGRGQSAEEKELIDMVAAYRQVFLPYGLPPAPLGSLSAYPHGYRPWPPPPHGQGPPAGWIPPWPAQSQPQTSPWQRPNQP